MDSKRIFVSVLTPTWNRAEYLERVWEGLNSQTYRNFEWVVANDGSSDETSEIIHALASRSNFPIISLTANVHIGKSRMDNEAVAHANGDFVVWCDSDDYFLPQAIEQLVGTWNSIPKEDRTEYVGVSAYCADNNGKNISTQLSQEVDFDTTFNDLGEKLKVTGDGVNLIKTSEIIKYPFPEVDFYTPESVIWTKIGSMLIRVHPKIIQIKEYKAENCISFSGKMKYCRGNAYAMSETEKNLKSYRNDFKIRYWKLITYIRYSIHGEISLPKAYKLWKKNSSLFSFLFAIPIGFLFTLKDQLQGKVVKTHREFYMANKIVKISCNHLGGNKR